MTDSRPDPAERAAAIARARERVQAAAQANSDHGDTAVGPSAASRRRAKHPAAGSRIMAAGVAASAGMMLVATMAAAADNGQAPAPAAPQVVHRVVTIELPAQAGAPGAVAPAAQPQEVTVVREVRTLPAPATAPSKAPAATKGS